MHIDPDRILVVASRQFAEVKPDRVNRFMDTAMVADIFENAVDQADDAAFATDIFRRRADYRWDFRRRP